MPESSSVDRVCFSLNDASSSRRALSLRRREQLERADRLYPGAERADLSFSLCGRQEPKYNQ